MRFWSRLMQGFRSIDLSPSWNPRPIVISRETYDRVNVEVHGPFGSVPDRSREDIRREWMDLNRIRQSAPTSYFVDGNAVDGYVAFERSISDGAYHHVAIIRGEAGPELIVPIDNEPEETP